MATLGIILPIEEKPAKKLQLNEEHSDLLMTQHIEIEKKNKEKLEKQIISFLEKVKLKKERKEKNITKSKVGYLKEGYNNIYGINPIDRYNFVIDRYNEEFNTIEDKKLSRISTCKVIRRLYDFYTWITRLFLGAFLIITYYCYKYKYKKNYNKKSRVGMIVYKQYLFNENQDYYISPNSSANDNPSFFVILYCSFFLIFSIYIMIVFILIMIIPNLAFTLYLTYGLCVHINNTNKVKNIFANMLFDPKLDSRAQLNDYILVNKKSINYYEGTSYYCKLINLSEKYNVETPMCFMLHGDLFKREFEILWKAFKIQMIGIFGCITVGCYFYLL